MHPQSGYDGKGIYRAHGEGGYDGKGIYRAHGEGGYDRDGNWTSGWNPYRTTSFPAAPAPRPDSHLGGCLFLVITILLGLLGLLKPAHDKSGGQAQPAVRHAPSPPPAKGTHRH
jgi:hypothetical protein